MRTVEQIGHELHFAKDNGLNVEQVEELENEMFEAEEFECNEICGDYYNDDYKHENHIRYNRKGNVIRWTEKMVTQVKKYEKLLKPYNIGIKIRMSSIYFNIEGEKRVFTAKEVRNYIKGL